MKLLDVCVFCKGEFDNEGFILNFIISSTEAAANGLLDQISLG